MNVHLNVNTRTANGAVINESIITSTETSVDESNSNLSISNELEYVPKNFITVRNEAVASIAEILKEIKTIENKTRLSNLATIINFITMVVREELNVQIRRDSILPTRKQIILYLMSENIGLSKKNAERLFVLCIHTSAYQFTGWINPEFKTNSSKRIYEAVKNQLFANHQIDIKVSCILSEFIIKDYFIGEMISLENENVCEILLITLVSIGENHQDICSELITWILESGTTAEKSIRIEVSKSMIINYQNQTKELNLCNKSLTQFPPTELLKRFTHVKLLDLSYNNFTEVPANVFNQLPKLRDIKLNSNYITQIPKGIFCSLEKLEILDLSSNRIFSIEDDSFEYLPNLKALYLNKNLLTQIGTMFNNVGNLSLIDYSNNRISSINEDAFCGLEALSKLYLQYNLICRISNKLFCQLARLTLLNLSNNKILMIDPGSFDSVLNLRILLLTNNNIGQIPDQLLYKLNNLVQFDLSENPLKEINLYQILNLRFCTFLEETLHSIYGMSFSLDIRKIEAYYLNALLINELELTAERFMLYFLLTRNHNITQRNTVRRLTHGLHLGRIRIPDDTDRSIDFFLALTRNYGFSIINIINHNFKYFMLRDGEDKIKYSFRNNNIKIPIADTELNEKVAGTLLRIILEVNSQLDSNMINYMVIPELSSGEFIQSVNRGINSCILKKLQGLNIEERLTDDEVTQILAMVNIKQKPYINQQRVTNILMNQLPEELEMEEVEAKQKNIKKFFELLFRYPDPNQIKINHLKLYCEAMGVSNNRERKLIISILDGFINWGNKFDEYKHECLKEIREYVIFMDAQIRSYSPIIYYGYVVSTLHYRGFADVISLLKNDANIPNDIRYILELVVIYCESLGVDPNDTEVLSIFAVKDNFTNEDLFVSLSDIQYLNPKNATEFELSDLKVISFNHQLYQYLRYLLSSNNSETQISFEGEITNPQTQDLLNRLINMRISSCVEDGLLSKLLGEDNQLLSISKENLQNLLANQGFVSNLVEVTTREIILSDLKRLDLPAYLENLIKNKFTIGNMIADEIINFFVQGINRWKLQLTDEQSYKFNQIIRQLGVTVDQDINIPLSFKKELREAFRDDEFCTIDGDFGKLKYRIDELLKTTYDYYRNPSLSNSNRMLLAEAVIEASEQLQLSLDGMQLIDELFSKLSEFNVVIQKHQLAYLLGVIFLNMSSNRVLGYESGGGNQAFARFRLIGGYFLSMAIVIAGNQFNPREKVAISNVIMDAILSFTCSGILANRLFGNYHLTDLEYMNKILTAFLSVKINI